MVSTFNERYYGGAATAVETVSAAIMYDTTDFPVRTISIGDNLDILRGLNSVLDFTHFKRRKRARL